MSGYRGIPGRSCQVFAIFVGDVFTLTVFVALYEAEIYDVDVISTRFCASDQRLARVEDLCVSKVHVMMIFQWTIRALQKRTQR